MTVFVDTSALYIAVDRQDEQHHRVAGTFRALVTESVLTHSYVIAESAAVIERRLGREQARQFLMHLISPMEVIWVDESLHEAAAAAYVAGPSRGPSLVDYTSFELMRRLGIRTAFAVDRDFTDAGFDVIPG